MSVDQLRHDENQRLFNAFKSISSLNGKRILVTGANGLIAAAFVDFVMWLNSHCDLTVEVYALVRNLEKGSKRFSQYESSPWFHLIENDVTVSFPESIDVNVIDYVVHAASNAHPLAYSRYPVETMKANIMGTINFLEPFIDKNLSKFIFISSSEVYGENPGVEKIDESYYGAIDTLLARSSYSESKRAGETLCISYMDEYDINISIARIGYVFGPIINDDNTRADAQFLKNVVNHQDIIMKSDGRQSRSYCYVMDAVNALLHILILGEKGAAYNVASNTNNISIREYAQELCNAGNVSLRFETPDDVELKGYSKVQNSILDVRKITSLGWTELFSLSEAVQNMITIARNYRGE